MGRAPCCDKDNVKRGPWSPEEDSKLKAYIEQYGTGGNWIALPQKIGLRRCGKSCRLRWLNYLRPNIKHGGFSEEEDNIICSLYMSIGSRWSIIAGQLPGRTDNDIKNYWNTKLKKKLLGKNRKDQRARSSRSIISKRKENLMAAEAINNLCTQNQQPGLSLPVNIPLLDQEVHLQDQAASLTNLLVVKMDADDHHDHHQSIGNSFNNSNSILYPYHISSITEGNPCRSHFDINASSSTSLNSVMSTCSLLSSSYSCPIYGAIADLSIPYFPDHEISYNMDSLDMANRSTITSSTTPESTTSWGDMTSVIYSPMGYNYEICPQTIPQDCILEESSHFRMKQQSVIQ